MEEKSVLKKSYEVPATEVEELKYEGIICFSGELDGYGDEWII